MTTIPLTALSDALIEGAGEAPNPVYARLRNPTVAGFENALAGEPVAEDRSQAAGARGEVGEPGVAVVAVAAADQAEAHPLVEGVTHEVVGLRIVDDTRRVRRLAASMH